MKQHDVCKVCGHSRMVHLVGCQVKSCVCSSFEDEEPPSRALPTCCQRAADLLRYSEPEPRILSERIESLIREHNSPQRDVLLDALHEAVTEMTDEELREVVAAWRIRVSQKKLK